jgi:uncharacterized NAD(P)/FAD-binding protein YdhS
MKKVGIIGGGFSGALTAVHLINKTKYPLKIIVINEDQAIAKGIAYQPYSNKHLLNVITSKMSAFVNEPDHFLEWVMKQKSYKDKDRTLLANSFLPRIIYGEYLNDIWEQALKLAVIKNIDVSIINSSVAEIDTANEGIQLKLANANTFTVGQCIIATGNQLPRNPEIENSNFYNHTNYYQNPWAIESVQNTTNQFPILIIGNGLTMVDTLLGLQEHGYNGEIFSISPNGFNILPHRHNGLKYTKLVEELKEDIRLYDLVKLVNKHINIVREVGATAEPVIDSLRPYTQSIWKSFTESEKQQFMSRLRHLWGVARHRIPIHTHDKIQQLRIDHKLHIKSGKLINLSANEESITATYYDKKEKVVKQINVSRIINCTGPESDFTKLDNNFLKKSIEKGIIIQDNLKLGLHTDTDTFQVFNAAGKRHANLYTLGANLRGELWESTAVNELRGQTEKLAEMLLSTQD